MRSAPRPVRSRTRGARTATGPMPVMISRSGRWPWRTSRRRPSSVRASEWPSRNTATSASTARASRDRAPLCSTSVNGSENVDGWERFKGRLSPPYLQRAYVHARRGRLERLKNMVVLARMKWRHRPQQTGLPLRTRPMATATQVRIWKTCDNVGFYPLLQPELVRAVPL